MKIAGWNLNEHIGKNRSDLKFLLQYNLVFNEPMLTGNRRIEVLSYHHHRRISTSPEPFSETPTFHNRLCDQKTPQYHCTARRRACQLLISGKDFDNKGLSEGVRRLNT